jgi:hypothetical protein
MKTGYLFTKGIIMFALTIIFFIPMKSFSQPIYIFKNPTLVSGTALTKGAVYRFSAIKTGVDAIVTITDMTNGITLSDIDGTSSGYNEAFQPFINAPVNKEGYVEFRFDFVKTGTLTAFPQAYVPFTAIDIDGDPGPGGKVWEFDQFQMDNTYRENYSTVSNELTISTLSSNWREARNKTANQYPGIDTTTKGIMYTASYRNVSSVMYRTGAKNTYGIVQNRLRSVYFKDFIFAGGLLPLFGLNNFTGVVANHGADLKIELAAGNSFEELTVERNDNNKGFMPVASLPITYHEREQTINWHDNQDVDGTVVYRLKVLEPGGKTSYSSYLVLKGQQSSSSFKVYPSLVQSDATLSMSSSRNTQVTIRIADLSGRILSQQRAQISAGSNSVQLQGLSNLNRGSYVVVVDGEDSRQAQQIVKL